MICILLFFSLFFSFLLSFFPFFVCLCIYLYKCLSGRSKEKRKKVEHRNEEKHASMGDEYSHNGTN